MLFCMRIIRSNDDGLAKITGDDDDTRKVECDGVVVREALAMTGVVYQGQPV